MKIIRSTKCITKFATNKKKEELQTVVQEYGKVVNIFIDYFWDKEIKKTELLKTIVDIPETWLTVRLRKVAARNILERFFTGKYGSCYKPKNEAVLVCPEMSTL